MFSSRNIHFIILGVILGATAGYVSAFYRAQRNAPDASSANAPQNHPDVTNDEMLALFQEALERNPNEPELLARYANFLFDLERFPQAVEWYRRVLVLEPDNTNVRTDMATALWNIGDQDAAMAEYQKALEIDPSHTPTISNLIVGHMERGNVSEAADLLRKLEEMDPQYSGLPALRQRLQASR